MAKILNLSRETVTSIATAFSAFVSMLLLIFYLHTYWKDRKEEKVLKWQRVVVYDIIKKRSSGITFDDIKTEYLAFSHQSLLNIPKEKIQDIELKYVLLSLLNDNLIFYYKDKYFIEALDTEFIKFFTSFLDEMESKMMKNRMTILYILKDNPEGIIIDKLYEEYHKKVPDVSYQNFKEYIEYFKLDGRIVEKRGLLYLKQSIE
ncbi:hypothetical protein G4V39_04555 [Thermosulfuriphilus ammonigenes]|uniref:Uncharacterized protein n=1 Tax=Thermosulfuriphilus ammonigenes TaxID=1936021 RepID=A0A6G7PVE7_9BACT|nr:hypothetical protein [Thermosulfuriphilus ammonigenes]MBA2848244.1 hypothetical protein [Thermosulfuriphilus ammonigenes]QIJ71590.1 hypothetical protein G4V39_04555 [Thermosulfuriphilus ammonigenes]